MKTSARPVAAIVEDTRKTAQKRCIKKDSVRDLNPVSVCLSPEFSMMWFNAFTLQ